MTTEPRFADRLIAWQKIHGRQALPWQENRDPYRVWLSEIMLQQTQVSTVIPYYQRFLARFPDLATLAAAPVEEVIAHWSGLGYYARARNLHRCAREIVALHHGVFPETAEALATLPGIGRSTAAAIAAFCFQERAAILDGNVKRVLCRVFGIAGFPGSAATERRLWQLAESLLPEREIDRYTQGLMDLGATCCTRSKPACPRCPFRDDCQACRDGRQHLLPEKRPRPAKPERDACFLLISDGTHLLLERRPPRGIWGGLLVPPEGQAPEVLSRLGIDDCAMTPLPSFRHTFTHFHLTLHPVHCRVPRPSRPLPANLCWVRREAVADAGIPAPFRKLVETLPD